MSRLWGSRYALRMRAESVGEGGAVGAGRGVGRLCKSPDGEQEKAGGERVEEGAGPGGLEGLEGKKGAEAGAKGPDQVESDHGLG